MALSASNLLSEVSSNEVIQWSDQADLKETKATTEDNFKADQLIDEFRQGKTKKYKTADNPKASGVLLEFSYPEQWAEKEGTRPNTLKTFSDKDNFITLVICLEDFHDLFKAHIERNKQELSVQQKEAEYLRLRKVCRTSEEANRDLITNSLFSFYQGSPKVSKTIKSSIDGYPLFTTLVSGVPSHAGNEYPSDSIHNVIYINDQQVDLILSRFYPKKNNSEQSHFELYRLNKQFLQACIVLNGYNQKYINRAPPSKDTNNADAIRKNFSTDPNVTFKTLFADKTLQEIYEKAEKGDSNCQYMMGSFYATGEKVPKNGKTAFEWYKRSADQSNPAAQLLVGSCYVFGLGVARDLDGGLKWIKKSSDQGFPKAQTMLGLAYLDGAGVPKDINKAVLLLQKACDQDDYEAMVRLGLIYYLGDLVPQDQNKARALWRRAAAGGYKEAVKVLEMDNKGK